MQHNTPKAGEQTDQPGMCRALTLSGNMLITEATMCLLFPAMPCIFIQSKIGIPAHHAAKLLILYHGSPKGWPDT